ncbi:MAG: hypothetical protein KJ771_07125 [Nanoarchaeota archaeon]|nr:hypothetical protein [Nanoarchaeota archaeon]
MEEKIDYSINPELRRIGGLDESVKHLGEINGPLFELCEFFCLETYDKLDFEVPPPNSVVNIGTLQEILNDERIPFSIKPEPYSSCGESLGVHEMDIAPDVFGADGVNVRGNNVKPYEDLLTGNLVRPSNLHITYGFTVDLTPIVALRKAGADHYQTIFSNQANQAEAERILRVLKGCCKGQ